MQLTSGKQYDLFASISENAYVAIYAKDIQGRYLLFNKEASRIVGKQSEEVLGKDDFSIFPEKQAEKITADDRKVLAGGISMTIEDEITTVDGLNIYLTTKGPTFDENGNVTGLFGISRNITDHKKMVMTLKENSSMFNATQKLAHIGVWDWDADSKKSIWTEELYRIAGLDPSLPPPLFENLQSLYTPASWELLINGINMTLETGESHQLELVLVRPDGNTRNISVFGGAKYDDAGKLVGLFGTVQDITEKKQTEKALEESEKRYRELFDACPDGISLVGQDGRILRANIRQIEMFGDDLSENMIGKNVIETIAPEYRDNAMQIMQRRLNGEDVPPVEYLFLRKDGTAFYGELTATIMRNVDGTVSGYLCVIHDVTGQKKAAEALRESEEIFRQFMEHSPNHVYIKDEKLRFIKISKSMENLLGKPASELLGKDSYDLLPPEFAKKTNDDDKSVLRQGVTVTTEETRNGKIYSTMKFPIHREGEKIDYLAGFSVDITEHKKAEAELKNSETMFSVLFHMNPAACALSDLESRQFIKANQAFYDLFGCTEDEVIGSTAIKLRIMNPESYEAVLRKADPNGKITNAEADLTTKNGEIRHVLLSAENIDLQDKRYRFTVVHDITERKRTEAALANVQKLESLGLLAGGIAHDFNNLMGGVYGYIDMACEETDESKVSSYLSKAMNTIDRTRALTQQLLTFAKGGAPVQRIGSLFPFVQETAQFALSGANVSCRFDVPSDVWACNFDKNQIGQVIDNLIINAQQAMPVGGIIEMTARNVSLAENGHPLLPNGDYVMISVKDSGVGIPPEMTVKIFDPFFTTKAMGHGLGLATCYSIINRHGGCIDVESVQGKGSTFTVYLPASTESAIPSRRTISKTHEGNGVFLVMDDEQVMRDNLSDMLESFGYSVMCMEDGKSAVDFFVSETGANRKINGMIFDLTVPGGMGGKAAVEEIRKLNRDVPVFVASGYAEDPIMKTPSEFGFTASICKPFRKSELSEMLNRYRG